MEVEGPKGKTIVYVTDLYPEGARGALDLSPNAFRKIGDMKDGKSILNGVLSKPQSPAISRTGSKKAAADGGLQSKSEITSILL